MPAPCGAWAHRFLKKQGRISFVHDLCSAVDGTIE
jgi:hypothetical protein